MKCFILFSALFRERENKKSEPVKPMVAVTSLKKYKELFDSGVITQEEFDAKKKQLLGL